MELQITAAQSQILSDLTSPEIAAVGGMGSGKTFILTAWAWDRAIRNPPGSVILVVEPTWRQVKRTLVRSFADFFERIGQPYKLNRSDYTLSIKGREIWMASGEIPENLSGMNVACMAMDEFALQAEEVYRRASSRRRDPKAVIRQTLLVGTPEGFNWAWQRAQSATLVRMPTRENIFLPPDFMDQLKKTYSDPARWKMYVEGEAVQLSGGIYTNYVARHQIKCVNPGAGRLVVGMDFNVGHMTSPIARVLGDEIHVFSEITSVNTNTQEHVARIVEYLRTRCGVGEGNLRGVPNSGMYLHRGNDFVTACVDASSAARKTSATRSDKEIVRGAGFSVEAESSNPPVRERIAAVQYALAADKLFVDPEAAPITHKALSQHAYVKGSNPPEPQKRWGENDVPLDGAADAVGYLVWMTHKHKPARAL